MKFLRSLLLTFSCSLLTALPALALQEGRDYTRIDPPQAVEASGKIEVLEFFSYGCPHCATLEAPLEKWSKTLAKDVVVRRVPVTFNRPQWETLAKGYYALEALGEMRLHAEAFEALHRERVNLTDANTFAQWVAKKGVDSKRFLETMNSFAVASQLARAKQLVANYRVQGVPMLAIDGRYSTAHGSYASHEHMLQVVSQIIDQVRNEKRR